MIQKIALCKNALLAGAPVNLQVTGISMVPALWPGDFVTVRAVPADGLRLGDVIAFARDGQVIVHRIVGQAWDAANMAVPITRGDTQQQEDLPILPAEVLGIVTSVRRFGASRIVESRPSRLARAVSHAVRRSRLVRFLLEKIYSRVSGWIPVAQDERAAS